VKAAPPGWEPHQIAHRLDGWIIDPDHPDRIPTAVADMIARAMSMPGGDSVADVRARMQARQRIYDQWKVLRHG
jgi:hypothetical protein